MNRKERRAARARGGSAGRPPAVSVGDSLAAGVGAHQAGRFDEAEAHYQKVLAAQPGNPDAIHLIGVIRHQAGRNADARDLIAQAIENNPSVPLYHYNMATTLRQLGLAEEAVSYFRRAVELAPEYVDAHVELGNLLDDLGEPGQAMESHRRVLELDDANSDAHNALGTVLMKLGRHAESEEEFRRAVALDPSSAMALGNLGNALIAYGEPAASLEFLRRAVALEPNQADAHFNLAGALRFDYRPEEAEPHLRRVLALEPGHTRALLFLGAVTRESGRWEESETLFRRAIDNNPGMVDGWNDLGALLKQTGRFDESAACFDEALERMPDYQPARVNRALLRLGRGDFAAGWSDYLSRPSMQGNPDNVSRTPIAADLTGRHVAVLHDQGLGDEIFFLRFVPELARRGGTIIYRTDDRLKAMFGRLPFLDRVLSQGDKPDPPSPDDIRVSAGDLPFLLGMDQAAHIPPVLDLVPLAGLDARMAARLKEAGPPPYIGLTWRAGIQQLNRLSKIAPIDGIAEALRGLPATLIALQRDPGELEISELAKLIGRVVHDFTAINDDLEAMLALVGRLDDYVGVSNTNIHLMIARGGTCRILVPNPPDYRWMTGGDFSPWFPGSRIYRETPEGGWRLAFEALRADLKAAHGGTPARSAS